MIDALAQTICVVQMTGYTSAASPDCSKLASAKLARQWLREEVIPAVRAGTRSLLAMRAVNEWFMGADEERKALEASKEFFDKPTRKPSFAPGSKPGEILRRRLATTLKVDYVPVSPKVAQSDADDGDR